MNAYDFDKTIYKNDSSADFLMFFILRHPKSLCRLPAIFAGFVKFYVFKKGRKEDFKEKAFSVVKYGDINKDVADFWEKNRKKIKTFYLNQQREDDVIISASPRFLLDPVCKSLNIKHLICTEVSPEDGTFTGNNCWGAEKVKRFREIFGNISPEEFYSDSYSDSPMAEISEKAVLVKGDKLLPWK